MAEIYEIIESLCNRAGINGTKMSTDLGLSRSFLTELRKGRAKSVKVETAQKIANYFGVTVDYLLTGENKETPPTEIEDAQKIEFANKLLAAYGDVPPNLSPAGYQDAANYIRFVEEQERKKNENK